MTGISGAPSDIIIRSGGLPLIGRARVVPTTEYRSGWWPRSGLAGAAAALLQFGSPLADWPARASVGWATQEVTVPAEKVVLQGDFANQVETPTGGYLPAEVTVDPITQQVGIHVPPGSGGGGEITETDATPSTPPEDTSTLFALLVANRPLLHLVDSGGAVVPHQPAFWRRQISILAPSSGGPVIFGLTNNTVGASTFSLPTLASTNVLTAMRRMRWTSSASSGSTAGQRAGGQHLCWRGNAAGLGGFFFAVRAGTSTAVATQKLFIGLNDSLSGLLGGAEPSALTQCAGFGYDGGQTTWRVLHNDGSGSATAVDLGANFPVNDSDIYDLFLWALPNGSAIYYQVDRLGTAHTASGTMSTDLPTNTTFLTEHCTIGNGSTASAVQIDVAKVYMETAL